MSFLSSFFFENLWGNTMNLHSSEDPFKNQTILHDDSQEDLKEQKVNSLLPYEQGSLLSSASRRCGFVAIIGEPNAGKSTLLNNLTGQHISLVSRKAHATRFGIYGIVCHEDYQCVFVDTPGFLRKTSSALHRSMLSSLKKALDQSDVTLLVVDASLPISQGLKDFLHHGPFASEEVKKSFDKKDDDTLLEPQEKYLLDQNFENIEENPSEREELLSDKKAKKSSKSPENFMIVLNKIDLISKEKLFELASFYGQWTPHIAMISAKKEKGLDYIKNWVFPRMPEGPWLFSPEDVSQISQRTMAAEITRECLLDVLHEEIPYHLHVVSEKWTEKSSGLVLEQQILIDKDRYRRYILGHKGQRLKHIGMKARQRMSLEFGQPVHLYLTVKTDPQWCKRMDEEQG